MDVRRKTCLIIRKNNLYLVGISDLTKKLNWSRDCYDAWRTRDVEIATELAKKCDGTLMLFNPIVGQIREYA